MFTVKSDRNVPASPDDLHQFVGIGGLPTWLYWFIACSVVLAVAFPYPIVKYLLLAVFGFVYLSSYRDAPERTLLLFILGLPALVALVPADLIPVTGLNAETLVITSLLIAAAAAKAQQDPSPSSNPFTGAITFYVLVLLASAVLSYLTGSGKVFTGVGWRTLDAVDLFSRWKNQIFFVFLAPVAFRLLWNRDLVKTAVYLVGLTTSLVSVHAIYLMADEIAAGKLGGRYRAVGLMAFQPNLFGGFLALMLVIFISMLMTKDATRKERLLYAIVVVTASPALVYTFSRGAWLAVFAGLAYLALVRGARAAVVLLIIGFAISYWIPEEAISRVQDTYTVEDGSLGDEGGFEVSAKTRMDQWKLLPAMWLDAPLLGHGFGSSQSVWAAFGPSGVPKAAHSSIVNFVIEEGSLGLIAYIWLLWVLLSGARTVKRYSDDPFDQALAVGMIGALICMVVLDTSGTRFRDRGVTGYLWIVGGGVARLAWMHLQAKRPPHEPRSRRPTDGRPKRDRIEGRRS